VMDFPSEAAMAQRRAVVTVAGIIITYLLYLLLRRFDHKSLTTRIVTAFVGAVPCAIAISLINFYIFNIYDPAGLFDDPSMAGSAWAPNFAMEVTEVALSRYFFLAAWAGLYLAITYAAEVREVERRAAKFARAAQDAELRSLRYQVNPHFLFNTLNSLSSLVMTERAAEAETMIMNLATFYRTSLSGDPLDDVTLQEEVRLQRLYLDIETVRFPDRLISEIDIPEELLKACVPGMILQPLVENAIKYGVSKVNRPVTVSIRARAKGGRITLTVADDGSGVAKGADHGEGIGLANVRDRLAGRFGTAAFLDTETPPGGGFIVTIAFPEVHDGC